MLTIFSNNMEKIEEKIEDMEKDAQADTGKTIRDGQR